MNRYFALLVFFSLAWSVQAQRIQRVPVQKNAMQKKMYYEPLFTVADASWYDDVNEKGNAGTQVKEGSLSRPVYFWVKLRATSEEALALLEKIDNPVIIKLFRSSGYGTSPEWDAAPQVNELLVNDRNGLIARKREEMSHSKMFTYLIWQRLDRIKRPGLYVVKLVYYDNSPVNCGESPCAYQIKIDK